MIYPSEIDVKRWRLRDVHLVLRIKQPSFSINHKFWQLMIHNLEHGRKQACWKDRRQQLKTWMNSMDELLLWIIQNPWENSKLFLFFFLYIVNHPVWCLPYSWSTNGRLPLSGSKDSTLKVNCGNYVFLWYWWGYHIVDWFYCFHIAFQGSKK